MTKITVPRLIKLYHHGLGEFLALRATRDKVVLGFISFDGGKLRIKDAGILRDTSPSQVAACRESGILGAISDEAGHEWQALTFMGPDRCVIPADLSTTRYGLMQRAANQYRQNIADFCGSVYRGFQLMLDNHFLPVVLLQEIRLRKGGVGLAVCDLRTASIPLPALSHVNEQVRQSIAPRHLYEIEDVDVNEDEFSALFAKYDAAPG